MKPPKPLNLKTLFLTSLCLSLAPLYAFAESGGSSDGGLNTLKHIPVEDYATDLSDLKGYNVYKQKLEFLRKAAPALADKIKANMEKATIYLIPAKITELPVEVTGLRFGTEQDCYQTGREIFCNEAGMAARSEEKDGMAIMHEALMSVQQKKNAHTVRQVNVKLFAKNATPLTVGNALAMNNFGAHLGPIQHKIIASYGRQQYYDAILEYLKASKEACDQGAGVPEVKSLLSDGRYSSKPKWKGRTYAAGDRAVDTNFWSPFRHDMLNLSFIDLHGLGYSIKAGANAVFKACVLHPEQMGKEICEEVTGDTRLYRLEQSAEFPTFPEEHKLRSGAFSDITSEWDNGTLKGIREQALLHIAEHPSFRTLLAQTADPKELRKRIYDAEAEKCSPETSAVCFDKLLKPVLYRQTELQQRGEMNNRQVLCGNIETLSDDIKYLAARDEENQKQNIFDSPWDLKKTAPIQPPKKGFFPGNDPVDDWSKDAE